MTSVCISNCVNDARDPRMPVRATYVNLYKWPESDAEFVRSVTRAKVRQCGGEGEGGYNHHHHHCCRPRVVDSISCRQMYLRSYTFSREESASGKTTKCFGGGVKEKTAAENENEKANGARKRKKRKEKRCGSKRKCYVARKVKERSCSTFFRIFYRLLSCAATVDVADH